MTDDVESYVEAVPERHRETVAAVRDPLLELRPDAEETVKRNQPTSLVDGEDRFNIAHYAEHVNLGFFDGANVDDPDGLLEGPARPRVT